MTAQEFLKECIQLKDNPNLLKLLFFEFYEFEKLNWLNLKEFNSLKYDENVFKPAVFTYQFSVYKGGIDIRIDKPLHITKGIGYYIIRKLKINKVDCYINYIFNDTVNYIIIKFNL